MKSRIDELIQLQRKQLRALENIEGLLTDAIGAAMVGMLETHRIYKQKREARSQRRAGGTHTRAEWKALKAKYNRTCLKCGRSEPEIKLTKDHIDPEGTNDIDNLQPLCEECNNEKGDAVIDYRPQEDLTE